MLSHILHQAQVYERKHGRHPNVVYLNPQHLSYLKQEYPNLFSGSTPIPFGMRIIVQSSEAVMHPRVARLLLRAPSTGRKGVRVPRDSGAVGWALIRN